MFGYVVANLDKLTPQEKERYRSCYCGLCKALGDRHGVKSRVTINYDMTFLILVLSSLYREEGQSGRERCFVHPSKTHAYWRNSITDYAADMNVVLAYHNFRDNWTDDKNVLSFLEAKLFEKESRRVSAWYPGPCRAISDCMGELSAIEKSGEPNPDIPANRFGSLMGEIFAIRKDGHARDLRAFGRSLGKFIYILDACLDLRRDIKKELYNPMIATESESFHDILNLLMADCTENYKRLGLNQDRTLIENILYSGVWTRYETETKKTKRATRDDPRSL